MQKVCQENAYAFKMLMRLDLSTYTDLITTSELQFCTCGNYNEILKYAPFIQIRHSSVTFFLYDKPSIYSVKKMLISRIFIHNNVEELKRG